VRWSSLTDRALTWLLPVLAVVAEGALLAVIYVAVETTLDARVPLLGTLELSVAAGITALAAHRRWIQPDEEPTSFMLLLLGLGVVGWLWSSEARDLLLAGNPIDAMLHHPGGWLMLVAGMRGVGRAELADDRALTRLVLVGLPALSAPWALGQFSSPELRPVFTDAAFVSSLTFVTAGFTAAGLARLQEIGRQTGVDWRRDRSWLGTVLAILAIVIGIGLPAAWLLDLPADAVARGILEPILGILGYVLVTFAAVAALIASILARLIRSTGFELPGPMTPDQIARLQEVPKYTVEQLRGPIVIVVLVWGLLIVLGIVLLRVWMRSRARRTAGGATEERSFRIPPGLLRLPRVPRRATAAVPAPVAARDAVTAYLAALDEIRSHRPAEARDPSETPRAHARRAALGPELAALQADYALARYAERPITQAEHRRALGRWRRLRDRLRTG
jgi:hypothetical protein